MLEWSNPRTLGAFDPAQRVLAGFTAGVMPRTAGFNNIDVASMHPASWLVTDVLMFIGTGPAGTGGGLKITTFAVLFSIVVAELRGDTAVNMFGKRLPRSTHREALTVALLSVALVVTATFAIMLMSDSNSTVCSSRSSPPSRRSDSRPASQQGSRPRRSSSWWA